MIPSPILIVAALAAVLFEVAIFLVLAYAALRFATKFLYMQRDIEEIKIAIREFRQTS